MVEVLLVAGDAWLVVVVVGVVVAVVVKSVVSVLGLPVEVSVVASSRVSTGSPQATRANKRPMTPILMLVLVAIPFNLSRNRFRAQIHASGHRIHQAGLVPVQISVRQVVEESSRLGEVGGHVLEMLLAVHRDK